ncbi:MAG: Holliday junction branch migration protein RuvA [Lachnospiraceae bacterium]|nr:Holliday junction branch migration protein RuvA [Lachnospiraceae bacterium]
MIGFVRGIIADKQEDNVLIDVNGIGINVNISGRTAEILPRVGQETQIYTYTCVREDAFLLYGFLTKDDLNIFKQLISVNGIGPKGGLAILSVLTPDDLRFAILSGDAKAIAKAPGIGAKTAERVILELRDKVSIQETGIGQEMTAYESSEENISVRNDVVEALVALGYGQSEALKAVKQVANYESMDIEELLKAALKKMF